MMSDRLTKEQRHKNMSAIRGKNTKPELLVRKFLFSRGFRYRLNHPRLPGHPDLVLRKYRTVIFVNGCFWHGHDGCKYFVLPKTNSEFWKDKIQKNKGRDIKEQKELASMGWHCITVWECQLKPAIREQTLKSLEYTLNHIFLSDRRIKPYDNYESDQMFVAESNNYWTLVWRRYDKLYYTKLSKGLFLESWKRRTYWSGGYVFK